ncbi:MAG: hypothetical protein IKD64_02380 [Lachnospiraceae bacterium]|nr:hypothetical protein [Lachnospiraceae bacterium]
MDLGPTKSHENRACKKDLLIRPDFSSNNSGPKVTNCYQALLFLKILDPKNRFLKTGPYHNIILDPKRKDLIYRP